MVSYVAVNWGIGKVQILPQSYTIVNLFSIYDTILPNFLQTLSFYTNMEVVNKLTIKKLSREQMDDKLVLLASFT